MKESAAGQMVRDHTCTHMLRETVAEEGIIMRAAQISRYGGPEVLQVVETPQPAQPEAGQLLVHVAAAGVNPVDWKVREGYLKDVIPITFPATLGSEVAGTITAVGPGVSGFARGDSVNGATGLLGGYAEYALVMTDSAARIPAGVNIVEAAGAPIAAAAAISALNAGEVGAGTRILIHAAAGGVGSLAVQLARLRGAQVTAAASAASLDYVRTLGPHHVVDRTTQYEDTIGDFDVVLDGAGPEAQARSWKLLRRGGILLSLVAPPPQDVAAAHGVRSAMVYGSHIAEALAEVNSLMAKGQIVIRVSRTYPLEQAAAALAESQRGKVQGKLILTV